MYTSHIRTLVIDCDGTLSSGKQYIDHTGEKFFKDFHSRDIRAIRELVFLGVDVVVMSADSWGGTSEWAQRVGARFFCTRDKLGTMLKAGFSQEHTLVLGDDAWDVRAMQWAKYSACPANATENVISIANVIVLDVNGGEGVVANLLTQLYERGLIQENFLG